MCTPREPGIDEPVTLDELSEYLVGLLTPAQEERLLVRIARDSGAPSKLAKLQGIDARIRAVLDPDRRDQRLGSDPGPMDDQRAARLHAVLADLARRRSEQHPGAAGDVAHKDGPTP